MFRWENLTSHLDRMKNPSYYIAPVGDWTHDIPHTVASNMAKVSHALNHSATELIIAGAYLRIAIKCLSRESLAKKMKIIQIVLFGKKSRKWT